ncbi:DUF4283 domain protein [Medicago truncatula]|uniref:DUF4283 domain protein n=1 Tax=Medicago truncatula TaxID=3880 RepID=G7J379_MEDTR|nr:DUF4283 domain protein [Medicago truncatula]
MASTAAQSRVAKSFAQALTNSCLSECQNVLYGRFTFPKGSSPVHLLDLKDKILKFWKTSASWSMAPLGNGYFEFVFTSLNDLCDVRSIGSSNLSPDFLSTFAWTADFNPHTVQQTVAQTWIHLHGVLGTPLALDEVTKKITFGHFARVLIEIDITSDLHERILVERRNFDFYVDVEYEKLPLFYNSCKITNSLLRTVSIRFLPLCRLSSSSKTVVEIDPLIDDIIRSKAVTNCEFVGNVLNHEEEVSNVSVARVHEVQPLQVDDSVLVGKQAVVHQDNNSLDLRIVGPWSDAITDLDYIQDSPTWNGMVPCDDEVVAADFHALGGHVSKVLSKKAFGRPLTVADSNLSNFNANVIHDMQVLGLVPSEAQQFLSESWANMAQNVEAEQFQVVVPRKKKKNQPKQ